MLRLLTCALVGLASPGCSEDPVRPLAECGQDAAPDAARDAREDASVEPELDAAVSVDAETPGADAEVPIDAAAPLPAGCHDGLLVDMRAYFYSVIGRAEGDSAVDWVAVMQASGLPRGPVEGEVLPPDAPFYGLTQQINSAGEVRGRIFLPTAEPDAFGYYIHGIDVLIGDPFVWGWNDWLGGPPYAPRPCP